MCLLIALNYILVLRRHRHQRRTDQQARIVLVRSYDVDGNMGHHPAEAGVSEPLVAIIGTAGGTELPRC